MTRDGDLEKLFVQEERRAKGGDPGGLRSASEQFDISRVSITGTARQERRSAH